MNKEKLLELAKECDYAITGYIHSGSKIEYEIWGGSMETHKLNKFADLIIKECAEQAYKEELTVEEGMWRYRRILEHFGMEE